LSVSKKAFQLYLDTKVYRHVLAKDLSVSQKSCLAFLQTEGAYFYTTGAVRFF
jgi:hypothetical protein